MSLSRRLKDRFFSIQEDLSASVRGLASANVVEGASAVFDRVSTVTGVAAASAVGLGAGLGASPVYQKRTVNPESGSELLAYYQGQWEALHLEQEKNGRRARESDRIIAELHGRVAKQWRDTITLHSLLGQIPKINAQIQSIQMTLGELEPLFNNVEMSLMALEDTIDAHSLQERQQDRKQQLGLYEAQRRREFNELSEKLQRQHRSRREDVEAKEAVSKAQKQRIFQEKFENDVATFKTAPQETLKVPARHDPDASLETVDLDEEEEDTELEAFLEDVSPLPRDATPSVLSPSLSVESSVVVSSIPVTIQVGSDSSPDNAPSGVTSRAESIYFTPDTTLERLADSTEED
eukprot:maker-scaffold732_size105256-snap-gene-0.17 protein:Tk09370 transcript:maker-scaffold732_size105256-snap-gene-0.17-mRNA-1 annotation:"Dysbindin"